MTNNRLDEIRRWKSSYTAYHSDPAVALQRAFRYIDHMLQLLDARPAVAEGKTLPFSEALDMIAQRITAYANQRYREGVTDSIQQARHSGCSTCGETIADAITAALLQESG